MVIGSQAGFEKNTEKTRLAFPAALTFFESQGCLERVLSVSDLASSIPGTVSSKTGCGGEKRQDNMTTQLRDRPQDPKSRLGGSTEAVEGT